MKKILFVLTLIFVFVLSQAQERTKDLGIVDLSQTHKVAYNGTTADYLLPTTRDSIYYTVTITNQGNGPLHFYAVITLAPIAGADTTVAITVQGKKFSNESYSDIIASALTSVVSAEQLNVKTSLGLIAERTSTTAAAVDLFRGTIIANNDTITVAQRIETTVVNTSLYYSYLRFMLILTGNDSVGTGIKVKRIEIQFYE